MLRSLLRLPRLSRPLATLSSSSHPTSARLPSSFSPFPVLPTALDPASADFATRSAQAAESNERFQAVLRKNLEGGGDASKAKVKEKGKLLVRERCVLPAPILTTRLTSEFRT